jgi:hypothetical protein
MTTETYVGKFGSGGSGDGQFTGPTGIWIYGSEIYAVDSKGAHLQKNVNVFSLPAGTFNRNWQVELNYEPGYPASLKGITVYSGLVYVTSSEFIGPNAENIAVTNTSGVLQGYFGPTDNNGFYGLCVYNSELYTAGGGGFAPPYNIFGTYVYNLSNIFQRNWAITPRPQSISVYNGVVYVSDPYDTTVRMYTTGSGGTPGTHIGDWTTTYPAGGGGAPVNAFCVYAYNDQVYVGIHDTPWTGVQVFDLSGNYLRSFGSYGSGDGQFEFPVDIKTDGNYVYVLDSGNNRISQWTYTGPLPPVAPTTDQLLKNEQWFSGGANEGFYLGGK